MVKIKCVQKFLWAEEPDQLNSIQAEIGGLNL